MEKFKESTMEFINDFCCRGKFNCNVNNSFITLIPKCEGAVKLEQYRPISLVGCLYKVLAKVLSIRLKSVLPEVIGESQFAFIKGRQILDCSLIANEITDAMRKSVDGGICFKVDFEKSYDSVDWDFLELVMRKMGFGCKWIEWIMRCVTTPSISVLINGSAGRKFSAARGLRQGCPLSPFLFNMVGEALSLMLQKAVQNGLFDGFRLGNVAISHLQYADDTLILCKASVEQVQNVRKVLRCFQLVSGLKVNFAKSSLIGINIDKTTVQEWANLVDCKVGSFPCTYLGLPFGARTNSVSIWNQVVERCQKKLATWKAKHLSMAGRLVLINSVLASCPLYFMSLFPLPATIKHKLDLIMRRFLWAGSGNGRKIHFVDWGTICKYKDLGGLGIVDLGLRNRALLNKWLWRYGNEIGCLWQKVIAEKNGLDGTAIIPSGGNRFCSTLWKSISRPLTSVDTMSSFTKEGLLVSIGDGKSIDFWRDRWVNGVSLLDTFPRIFALAIAKHGKAADFGCFEGSEWKWRIELRRAPFDWEKEQWQCFLETINEFHLVEGSRDRLIWKHCSKGWYSANSFCKSYMYSRLPVEEVWKLVWEGLAPPKVEVFVWQVLRRRVAVKFELQKRGLISLDSSMCAFCGIEIETVEHLFVWCHRSWAVWMACFRMWKVSWVVPKDPSQFFLSWQCAIEAQGNLKVWKMMFFAVIWSIWLHRNDIVFNQKQFDVLQLLDIIKVRLACWVKAASPDWVCSFSDMYCFPTDCAVSIGKTKVPRNVSWSKPEVGFMKFNVDGAVRGKPGPAGIGGVLKDANGKVWMQFSKSLGIMDSNEAEVCAVREALIMFCASRWVESHGLVVESDSTNAVHWVEQPDDVPWKFRKWIVHIGLLGKRLTAFKIAHIFREANQEADVLAKGGVDRVVPLVCSFN